MSEKEINKMALLDFFLLEIKMTKPAEYKKYGDSPHRLRWCKNIVSITELIRTSLRLIPKGVCHSSSIEPSLMAGGFEVKRLDGTVARVKPRCFYVRESERRRSESNEPK